MTDTLEAPRTKGPIPAPPEAATPVSGSLLAKAAAEKAAHRTATPVANP